jgi:lipoprotein-releasing system ATP-binding protein
MGILLNINNVYKSFPTSDGQVLEVLNGVNFCLEEKSIASIVGTSGSGKSTLLHIIGGLDKADSGQVVWNNQDITHWDEFKMAEFRNNQMGFIFQFHHLLPEFTAIENVMIPAIINGKSESRSKQLAYDLLNDFGLARRLEHRPNQLSGGEQQRVAMARALINEPSFILADEPTGNLDDQNTEQILSHLIRLRDQHSVAILMVTHEKEIAQSGDVIWEMKDGLISQQL